VVTIGDAGAVRLVEHHRLLLVAGHRGQVLTVVYRRG
jgi:hypothetical protein